MDFISLNTMREITKMRTQSSQQESASVRRACGNSQALVQIERYSHAQRRIPLRAVCEPYSASLAEQVLP